MSTSGSNGRFDYLFWGKKAGDPDRDFPMTETFEDFAGEERVFEITLWEPPTGHAVQAAEVGKDNGYLFVEFDTTCPYVALGRLRGKVRRALATRHLQEREDGCMSPTHDVLRGRITMDSDTGAIFVIDGKPLSLEELGDLLLTHEGWQFRLQIIEPADEVD